MGHTYRRFKVFSEIPWYIFGQLPAQRRRALVFDDPPEESR